ncbi:MAG: adenylyl-sulfate kinase [Owenweeksia sp.]|nr:adenylyl-sulfate kinase [Owenweeksia sp.]
MRRAHGNDAGVITITAFISPFRKERKLVKDLVGEDRYIEIFVDCPLEECAKMPDVIKVCMPKRAKEKYPTLPGISSPFEEPENPTVTVKTAEVSVEEGVEKILKTIETKIKNLKS